MIGNETDALLALDRRAAQEFILSTDGSTRITYLINGVVYKVLRGAIDPRWMDANTEEAHNADVFRPLLPEGVSIPEMRLFEFEDTNVLACEFIDGILSGECSDAWTGLGCEDGDVCIPGRFLETLNDMGWHDSAWGNVILADGIYHLVDVAC